MDKRYTDYEYLIEKLQELHECIIKQDIMEKTQNIKIYLKNMLL